MSTPVTAATPYKIHPAEPILAHTLLHTTTSPSTSPPTPSTSNPFNPLSTASTQWNLALDIDQGLGASNSIFRPGTVLGFSRLRGRVSDGEGDGDGDGDEFVGGLPRYLLTKWLQETPPPLLKTSPSPSSENKTSTKTKTKKMTKKTFIIHPPTTKVFSPESLLLSLLSHQPRLPRKEAITHLDSVTLFPVFGFGEVVGAVQEISEILHQEQSQTRTRTQTQNDTQNDTKHGTAGSESTPIPAVSTVLILTGLDTLTESIIRSSNAVRGAAVLSSLLRTLTQLSRIHHSSLSILLVNLNAVGPFIRAVDRTQAPGPGQGSRDAEMNMNMNMNGGSGTHSIFSTTKEPLFPSLLMRTLDQGIDTHLLLSRLNTNTQGVPVPVVEVVKDRVGEAGGRWCVWEG